MASTAIPRHPAAEFSLRQIIAPLVAIIVGIFMVVLDATAVNVAVPTLVRDLHSSISTMQWTITGYALAQAAVIPLAGWLSDRFGAKNVFLVSLGLFTLGSVLCATAATDTMLILFRVLQGLGGGFVLPVAMAYVYRLSPPERAGSVMGVLGVPILLAPAIGPVLAGWLVQFTSWRWIFLINLPIGIVGLFLVQRTLPRVERSTVAGLDLPGMVFGPLAFVALSYGVSQGGTSWTSAQTLGGLIVGAIALLVFVAVELRAQAPLLELRVFRSVDFSLSIVVQWLTFFAMFGTLFLVPLFLQEVRGYGAFDTGLILLPNAIAAAVLLPIGGRLFDGIGARPLVVAGLGLVSGATFLLSRVGPATQGTDLIVPLALLGAGMGVMMMAINTHLLNAAPRKLVSRVTSLTNALQQVINSLSVATLATILTVRSTMHVDAVKASLARAAHASAPAGGTSGVAHGAQAVHAAIMNALAKGFDDTFLIVAALGIVGMLLGLTLRRRTQPAVAEVEEETNAELAVGF